MNFEKSIAAYEKNIDALNQSATDLIESNHYEADIIKRRQIEVLEKWRKLKGSAAAKSEKLGESKLLFQFLRDADEVKNKFDWQRYFSDVKEFGEDGGFMIMI